MPVKANTMSKNHDNETLFNALEHIVYELQMFVDLTFTEMPHPMRVQFAILESWLIHLRGIESMLEKKQKSKTDDILIAHFGPIDISTLVEPAVRKRVSGEIAHITTRRMSDSVGKTWDRMEIFRQAWPGIAKIIAVLETWVESYRPESRWGRELVATREHGAILYEGITAHRDHTSGHSNSGARDLHPLVTYTVGYLPGSKSVREHKAIVFM